MKGDVTALIQKMTAERNALDRAITALVALDLRADPPTQKPAAVRKVRKTRRYLDDTIKAFIVAAMTDAPHKWQAAVALGRQHGVNEHTIYTRWTQWRKVLHGAASPAVQPDDEQHAVAM